MRRGLLRWHEKSIRTCPAEAGRTALVRPKPDETYGYTSPAAPHDCTTSTRFSSSPSEVRRASTTFARFWRTCFAAGESARNASRKSRITTSCSAASRPSPSSRIARPRGSARVSPRRAIRCRSTSGCATGIRFSTDTLREMRADGAQRAIGFIAAAQHSLFELPAVPRERRRGAGGAARA